jgi:hypothetical protein
MPLLCARSSQSFQSRRAQLSDRNCQSIAGPPVDEAIAALIAERMTPAAVALALEIRREIETRQEEADRLRCRAIERAKFEADLAQRRFMLVDPGNRLVANTLEAKWNDKLRTLAQVREKRERRERRFLQSDAAVPRSELRYQDLIHYAALRT